MELYELLAWFDGGGAFGDDPADHRFAAFPAVDDGNRIYRVGFRQSPGHHLRDILLLNKVKAGYSRNLETVPKMIASEQGKRICTKIDNDIKKGRLDHNTMVGRVDTELGKKLTRGNAEKALNPPKKPVIGLA